MATTITPPRVGLRLDGQTLPALALSLRGDAADLVLPVPTPVGGDLRLVLDWATGEVTELGARVRAGGPDAEDFVTCVAVEAVEGDWAPFVAWLGAQAS